ncbi:hypothetical protein GP486_001074 [Trichoglossum hirsutum]|uniref:Calcineurin-like phosphoesterase domain-containing protein n=1 Tax=Trichoglossum hirsutum TaxID=265104 RepID=A0A9P8LHK0_9PEZI|nr:hypothetical protein GP486_001074 [Trichoglossum hirsutum]
MDRERRGSWSAQQEQRNKPWTSSRRPLVDFTKNDWQTNPRHDQSDDLQEPPYTTIFRSQRFMRHMAVYMWLEDVGLSYKPSNISGGGRYGVNVRPKFTDMLQIKALDKQFVPSTGMGRLLGEDGERRLVVVGDVHGCKDELVKLLHKMSFNPKSDHLVLAGDLIKKGPDSIGVIDLARQLKASCVRGNHEDRVLLAYRDLHAKHLPLPGPMEDPHAMIDDLDEELFGHGNHKDRKLARKLDHERAEWLRDCPLILNVGDIESMGEVAVVHAGLVPGVDLENQDPFNVMNMRTIDRDTLVPSSKRKGVAWTKLWKLYQQSLPHKDRMTVIYGHDSHRGLSIGPYSKGLDSGCVGGGRLTALVIESGEKKIRQEIVSVKCKDYQSKESKKDEDD